MVRTRSGRETSRTYVRDKGWLYLAVVIDLWSRTVIGWSMLSAGDADDFLDSQEMKHVY
ncbi:integrase [Escherichia coli]|nr:Transposase insF for insertion sequence IS3A/B/C/D/E/fA [Escherichia coli VL2874]GCG27165.1 integrase [Escherichia coli]GCG54348.1 integrase [Escherichia coli]GCN64265.1 integrase [Escherichia coli]GDO22000.1 integrase [Escherichia coli]